MRRTIVLALVALSLSSPVWAQSYAGSGSNGSGGGGGGGTTNVTANPTQPIATTDQTVTLAANTNQQVLPSNGSRGFLEIVNTCQSPISYRFGAAASATSGRILSAGQSATYSSGSIPNGALNLFSTAACSAFVTGG